MVNLRRFLLAALLALGLTPAIAQAPSPVPALPDAARLTTYSISASTCACAVNFALYGNASVGDYYDWVQVYLNGNPVAYNDATYGWTITSPSGPLASIARPITDAVLTFTNAQTGTVQIIGAYRPARLSQWQENQGVPARNLNVAMSSLVATQRETWDRLNDVGGIVSGLTKDSQGNIIGHATLDVPLPTPLTNVSGSSLTTAANVSCTSGSPNVTLNSAGDFANGQGIRIDRCGATFGLGAPTGLTITPTGTTGSTTYTYTVAPIDTAGGVGPAIAAVSTTTGNATLSATNYNALAWTAPGGTAPSAYAVYETAPVAQLVGVTNFVTSFKDFGLGGVYVPDWLSPTPPASATNDWLLTTISAGGGTTSLTVAANASQTTSTAVAAHDDTIALQAALTASASSVLSLPCGKYMLTGTLQETDLGTYYIRGQGNCTQFWFVDSQGLTGIKFLPAIPNGNVDPTAAIEQVWLRKLGAAGGIAARFGNESVLFRNNTVQGRWANGVYLTTSYAPTIDFNEFIGGISGNVIDCTADSSCNNARIWRNGIFGNGWAGGGSAVAFGNGQGWSLIGDDFEGNYNELSFNNTYAGTIESTDFESSTNALFVFVGVNGNLNFTGNTFAGNPTLTLSGTTIVNSKFDGNATYNTEIDQGTALTVTGTNNVSSGTGGIMLPGFKQYTIANLPTCSAATNLAKAYVTNGVASPAFLGAVSTTGAALQPVGCNGTAWVYGG